MQLDTVLLEYRYLPCCGNENIISVEHCDY